MVLEEIQYNGFCGCSYCVEAGKTAKANEEGNGPVHVYPFNDESNTGHAELRTHEGTIANGMKALEDPRGKPVSVLGELIYSITIFLCISYVWGK